MVWLLAILSGVFYAFPQAFSYTTAASVQFLTQMIV